MKIDMTRMWPESAVCMAILVAITIFALSGCETVSQVIPSLKYCDHVFYERTGRDIQIEAECTLPAGIEAPL